MEEASLLWILDAALILYFVFSFGTLTGFHITEKYKENKFSTFPDQKQPETNYLTCLLHNYGSSDYQHTACTSISSTGMPKMLTFSSLWSLVWTEERRVFVLGGWSRMVMMLYPAQVVNQWLYYIVLVCCENQGTGHQCQQFILKWFRERKKSRLKDFPNFFYMFETI